MGIKYKINEDFFKKWTKEMAYVLGYIYADGSLENASNIRGKYLRISSVEKNTIIKIKNCLKSEHKIVKRKPRAQNRKIVYLLRIGSKKIYEDLTRVGLFPHKSLTIKFPKISRKYLRFFILGYFDGDGCIRICYGKGKNKKIILKKLSLVFTSGSRNFLESLSKNISTIVNIKPKNVYNGHRSYMLCYSTSDSIKLFKFFYEDTNKKLFLKRKFCIFKKYFSKRKIRIDSSINKILRYNSTSNGRVAK